MDRASGDLLDLPIRDGNAVFDLSVTFSFGLLDLPIRDGNWLTGD